MANALFKQHEFNRDVDATLEITRLYLLVDELEKSEYREYLTAYCASLHCAKGFDLVARYMGIFLISNKSNDGKNRVFRLQKVPEDYRPLLDKLSHPVSSEAGEWRARTLKSLKQFPLNKDDVGEYHVLNWNFVYRSAHQTILRDFYYNSGIAMSLKSFGDFKSWVGAEITEKRLLRTILRMIYKNSKFIPIFPDEGSSGKPDAYV